MKIVVLPPLPTPVVLEAVIQQLTPKAQALYAVADPAGQEVLDAYAGFLGQFYAVLTVLEQAPAEIRQVFAEVYGVLAQRVSALLAEESEAKAP